MRLTYLRKSLCLLLLLGSITIGYSQSTYQSTDHLLPDLLTDKIKAYQSAQKPIDAIAFTPTGQWVLVAKNYRFYSKVKTFNANGLRSQLENWLAEKKRIDVLAINSKEEWLMLSGRSQAFSDNRYFERIGLLGKLVDLRRKTQTIRTLALGPQDSWVLVTKTGGIHFSDNLSRVIPKLWQLLVDCRDSSQRPVKLINIQTIKNLAGGVSKTRWVLVADDYYWSENWTPGGREALRTFRSRKWAVNYVALSPIGGWSVISNQRFFPSAGHGIANNFENGFRKTGVISKVNLEERMMHHRVPGVSIVVIKNGAVVLTRGYGETKAFSRQPVLAGQTRFPVASLSKMPASLALLHLIGRTPNWGINTPLGTLASRLTKNQPNSDFMYWYNRSEKAKSKNVTTRQLLSHSSGLGVHGIGQDPLTRVRSTQQLLRDNDLKFLHSPNRYWDYSGGGYTVAEALLEAISKRSYESYFRSNIFSPLRMNRSHFKPSGFSDAYFAFGHDRKGNSLNKSDCPGEAAGGLICTAIDYSRLVQVLMNDGNFEGRNIVAESLINEMLTNTVRSKRTTACTNTCSGICHAQAGSSATANCATPLTEFTEERPLPTNPKYYGLGISLSASLEGQNYPTLVWHRGTQRGYHAAFWAYPSENTALIILTNGTKEWTDGRGHKRGAQALTNEIRNSFNEVYR